MRSKTIIIKLMISVLSLSTIGCATRAPTIAHVHLGHVVDGWETTPGQAGLIETAENFAQISLESAERASDSGVSLEIRQNAVEELILASHPEYFHQVIDPTETVSSEIIFGVRTALVEATHHIEFAADSDDASANVKAGSMQFTLNAQTVLDRCDLIAALGTDSLEVTSVEEVDQLTEVLLRLAQANLDGEDLNGDGIIGGAIPEEYGLKQLSAEIEDMINRESPPYSTVDQWYLFNLIRLPNGKWTFRRNADKKGGASY